MPLVRSTPVTPGHASRGIHDTSGARGVSTNGLRDTVTSLDRDNTRHLTTAIRKAAGHG